MFVLVAAFPHSSLFGGHTIGISGNGFGTSSNGVVVAIGNTGCQVRTVTDTQILCTTMSSAARHRITNNAYAIIRDTIFTIPSFFLLLLLLPLLLLLLLPLLFLLLFPPFSSVNPEYGLGYAWEPASLTIKAGDSVHWSWTGSAFTPTKRLVQVPKDPSTITHTALMCMETMNTIII